MNGAGGAGSVGPAGEHGRGEGVVGWSSCLAEDEPRRNWCLACFEDRPEDCSVYGREAEPWSDDEGEGAPSGPLAVEVDPNDCARCVEAGDLCPFHAGFADGWDACAELVARMAAGDD